MADCAEIDIYGDDIEPETATGEMDIYDGVDLYDDVIAAPQGSEENVNPNRIPQGAPPVTPGPSPNGLAFPPKNPQILQRFQLYVGNLTWWTTDQDITDAVLSIGVTDFMEVKFFENRANGQSKGFCVISLGSEPSMRICLERLPKKELHGQLPVVTFPSKQALSQFESQSKTRSTPPQNNQGPPMQGPPLQGHPGHPPMPPIQGPPGPQQRHPHPVGPRMVMGPGGPPMGPGGPQMGPPPPIRGRMPPPHGPPPGYQQHWNGPPRQNGPPRPPGPHQGPGGPPGPQQRPPGMRPDWGHRPGPGGPPPGHPGQYASHHQGPPMQGPPGPPPGHGGPPGAPAPHVNPAFFQSQHGHPGAPHPVGPPHPVQHPGGPPPSSGPPPGAGYGPRTQPSGKLFTQSYAPPPPDIRQDSAPAISDTEFEEIMGRNRTVSSSAIARAVSDAAAGEYASAIETLVTAISLIKQSKVANDDRCKILISSLQDTLHGVEAKSYGSSRRDRSRSRDRDRHRRRRERSRSRDREYRDRSRERDRERLIF
ncbi:Cleavage and polyadenylation specificity factor, putative [Pediculus humanus corporis]|uniref:Cleavage and polyadenylation specificity factor subunit 6 n=1 Tax=Pediculus humanus subsp. corporis TaxID=121224 RepID=E0W031_PEDHC|nr:Cleavage and polyadenylation specificity factor, putative [Pediculus humanus corporis]EEB18987.1 Cleavage and polyadenylation specificity factor, putative [Pediculus humanus corporis]